jgi:hypothetical protein
VLKCHASQALSCIGKFSQQGYFLSVLAKESKNGLGGGGGVSSSGGVGVSSSGVRLKSVGVAGEVVLWGLSNDVNCREFVGHEGSVVGIAGVYVCMCVPPPNTYTHTHTHTP